MSIARMFVLFLSVVAVSFGASVLIGNVLVALLFCVLFGAAIGSAAADWTHPTKPGMKR